MMDPNKLKSLELAMKQIDKTFGKGTLMRLGDKVIEPIGSISTGSLGLDLGTWELVEFLRGVSLRFTGQRVQEKQH